MCGNPQSLDTFADLLDGTINNRRGEMYAVCKARHEKTGYPLRVMKGVAHNMIEWNEIIYSYPKVKEKLNLLEESVSDDPEHLEVSKDGEAKTGHKTADTAFFGYNTHIAMTEERIITAATVTSGEKTDRKELPDFIRKSRTAGMEVETVIGDKEVYSEQKNIEAEKAVLTGRAVIRKEPKRKLTVRR